MLRSAAVLGIRELLAAVPRYRSPSAPSTNGYLVPATGLSPHVGLGPRVENIAARWNITRPLLPPAVVAPTDAGGLTRGQYERSG